MQERQTPSTAPLIKTVSLGLLVLFTCFLAVAVLSPLKHRHGTRQYAYDQNFVAIQADAVERVPTQHADGFSIVTRYRFTPPGRTQSYEGHDQFDLRTYQTRNEAETQIAKGPEKVTVYFSPENPADSSAKASPPSRPPGNFLLLVAGLAGALSCLFAGMRIAWDQFWRRRELTKYNLFSLLFGTAATGLGLLLVSLATLFALIIHALTGNISFSYRSPRTHATDHAWKEQDSRDKLPSASDLTPQQVPAVKTTGEEPTNKSRAKTPVAVDSKENQVQPSPAASPTPSKGSRSGGQFIQYILPGVIGGLGLVFMAIGLLIALRSLKSKPRVCTELF